MKNDKLYIYGTLLALPFMGILYYLLTPPQCPLDYTQEQINASGCIVGANIGGLPLLIITASVVWLVCVWLIRKIMNKKSTKR